MEREAEGVTGVEMVLQIGLAVSVVELTQPWLVMVAAVYAGSRATVRVIGGAGLGDAIVPAARLEPRVHVTVVVGALKAHVQLVPDADTKLSPVGSWSVTVGEAASEGPAFATFSV